MNKFKPLSRIDLFWALVITRALILIASPLWFTRKVCATKQTIGLCQ